MKFLILLPSLLAIVSACLRDSLIINGLINGRFAYLGHNLPEFVANSPLELTVTQPVAGTTGLSGYDGAGINEFANVNGFTGMNGVIGVHDLTGVSGLAPQLSEEVTEIDEIKGVKGATEFTEITNPYSGNTATNINTISSFQPGFSRVNAFESVQEVIPRTGSQGGTFLPPPDYQHAQQDILATGQFPIGSYVTEIDEMNGVNGATEFTEGSAFDGKHHHHHNILNGLQNVFPSVRNLEHNEHHLNWIPNHHHSNHAITEKKVISKETTVDVKPHGSFVDKITNTYSEDGVNSINTISPFQAGFNQVNAFQNVQDIIPRTGSLQGNILPPPSYQHQNILTTGQFPRAGLAQGLFRPLVRKFALNQLFSGQNLGNLYPGELERAQYFAGPNSAGVLNQIQYPVDQGGLLNPAEVEIDKGSPFLSGLAQSAANNVQYPLGQAAQWQGAGLVVSPVVDSQQNLFLQYLLSRQFPYLVPGYMNQYGINQQFDLPSPYYSYPAVNFVGRVGVEQNNPHHEDHDHQENSVVENISIFSRSKTDDDGENDKNNGTGNAEFHTTINVPKENFNVSEASVSEVELYEKRDEGKHEYQSAVSGVVVNKVIDEKKVGEHQEHKEGGEENHENITKDTEEFVTEIKKSELPALDLTPRVQATDSENEVESLGSETLLKRSTQVGEPRVVTLTIKIPPKTTTKEIEVTKTAEGYGNEASAEEHQVTSETIGPVHVSVNDSHNVGQETKDIIINSLGNISDLIAQQ